ncbi:MAG: hypothetical protein Q9169_003370 [Polycauliona sp. 2 TL-2023]
MDGETSQEYYRQLEHADDVICDYLLPLQNFERSLTERTSTPNNWANSTGEHVDAAQGFSKELRLVKRKVDGVLVDAIEKAVALRQDIEEKREEVWEDLLYAGWAS